MRGGGESRGESSREGSSEGRVEGQSKGSSEGSSEGRCESRCEGSSEGQVCAGVRQAMQLVAAAAQPGAEPGPPGPGPACLSLTSFMSTWLRHISRAAQRPSGRTPHAASEPARLARCRSVHLPVGGEGGKGGGGQRSGNTAGGLGEQPLALVRARTRCASLPFAPTCS